MCNKLDTVLRYGYFDSEAASYVIATNLTPRSTLDKATIVKIDQKKALNTLKRRLDNIDK